MLSRGIVSFVTSRDPDAVLMEHLSAMSLRQDRAPAPRAPGQPLEVLLSGYFGAGNTGSEMRASEIVRHMRRLLGPDNVAFSALSLTNDLPRDLFPGVRACTLSGFYPDVVAAEIAKCHAVVACEGSTFKSTFSEVLTALMAGTLGAAARAEQPAIAYGAEVGTLTPRLEAYVRDNARGALIMARNQASVERAEALGLRTLSGADTAWTFTPSPPEVARQWLVQAGWNGVDPIVVFCPVNPFWWPVRAEPATFAAMQRTGQGRDRHYGAVFFHSTDEIASARYGVFIRQLADAFERLRVARNAFPVVIGMDRVDAAACADLTARMPFGAAVFRSGEHDVGDLIAILRQADLVVSARFHALVGAMPSGAPSIGLAFDERVGNLMRGAEPGRALAADAPDLADQIVAAAGRLDPDVVRAEARARIGAELDGMARMAHGLRAEFGRFAPDLSLPDLHDGPVGALPLDVQRILA
jgi:polysaccharide pyruvyl transferase WcaK-like protein